MAGHFHKPKRNNACLDLPHSAFFKPVPEHGGGELGGEHAHAKENHHSGHHHHHHFKWLGHR